MGLQSHAGSVLETIGLIDGTHYMWAGSIGTRRSRLVFLRSMDSHRVLDIEDALLLHNQFNPVIDTLPHPSYPHGYIDFAPLADVVIRKWTEGEPQYKRDFNVDEYKRNQQPPSAEELFEMRATFGEGTTVVNILTGSKTEL